MDFSDILKTAGYGPGTEVQVRGHLVVTESVAYLVESETSESKPDSEKSILIAWPALTKKLLASEIPVMVGSMVLFSGPAEITGTISRTGMGLLPFAIYNVREAKVWSDGTGFKI
jgi:hypothetical protein